MFGTAVSRYHSIPAGSPLYFSPFVFPIYSYDSMRNSVQDQNALGYSIYGGLMSLLMWGIVTIVFVDPLDIGIGITAFFLVAIAGVTIYLVSLSPVRLAEALLCIDESELETATKYVKEEFLERRKPFQVRNKDFDEATRQEEMLQKRLNKYANWSKPKKIKLIKHDQRFSAGDVKDRIEAVRKRLYVERRGDGKKRKKMRPFRSKMP